MLVTFSRYKSSPYCSSFNIICSRPINCCSFFRACWLHYNVVRSVQLALNTLIVGNFIALVGFTVLGFVQFTLLAEMRYLVIYSALGFIVVCLVQCLMFATLHSLITSCSCSLHRTLVQSVKLVCVNSFVGNSHKLVGSTRT